MKRWETCIRATLVSILFWGALADAWADAWADARPVSSPVPYEQALNDAIRLRSLKADWQAFQAVGDSMLPHYSDHSVLLLSPVRFDQIENGMMIAYVDQDGDLVGHLVVSVDSHTVTTRGANNERSDPMEVSPSQIVGQVFGVLHGKAGTRCHSELPVIVGKRY